MLNIFAFLCAKLFPILIDIIELHGCMMIFAFNCNFFSSNYEIELFFIYFLIAPKSFLQASLVHSSFILWWMRQPANIWINSKLNNQKQMTKVKPDFITNLPQHISRLILWMKYYVKTNLNLKISNHGHSTYIIQE